MKKFTLDEIGIYFIVLVVAVVLGIFIYAPHREKVTFNKFRDPNTPAATYFDATTKAMDHRTVQKNTA